MALPVDGYTPQSVSITFYMADDPNPDWNVTISILGLQGFLDPSFGVPLLTAVQQAVTEAVNQNFPSYSVAVSAQYDGTYYEQLN